jgi:hypothetical protein
MAVTPQSQIEDQEAVLADAGERWLEAKAGGRSTAVVEAEVRAAEETLARLQRQHNLRRST